MILNLKFVPRWIIFLLDLGLVMAALFCSYFLRFNFKLEPITHYPVFQVANIILLVNSALFFIFKSYSGIVRHTTLEDTGKFLLLNLVGAVSYLILDICFLRFTGRFEIPVSVVIINFFVINFCLVGYRLLIRTLFSSYKKKRELSDGARMKVAIFNTDEQGLLTKRVISESGRSNMEVIAFLDDQAALNNKVLEGLPIYHATEASIQKLTGLGVELLIVATKNAGRDRLNLLVDMGYKYGLRVQQVPPIQQWIDGKLKPEQLKDIRIEDLLERDVIKIENPKVRQEYGGKRILVTGAAGSIGSEIVRQLTAFNPSLLIICDKAETPMHDLNMELQDRFKEATIVSFMGDICDRVRMEQLFEIYNPDVVFHAAAYKHVPLMEAHPSLAVVNNILGTKNLVELSVANGVEKFVMISTDKAVNPTNIMGASKRIAEIYAQSYYHMIRQQYENLLAGDKVHPTRFVTTRFGNVLGSNGSVIPHFKKQLDKGGPLTVTHPDITRYFMTIPEACQLVLEAGAMGEGGEIFVFDMGKPVKIVDLARKMIYLSGKEPDTDIQIVFTGLRPGEKLYEELLNNAENTVPTYHEKIMIARVREYDYVEISLKIDQLIASARGHYSMETVQFMKELVPEFISNNSHYQVLDNKS